MKKKRLISLALTAAVIVALLWFFLPSKTFDELMPVPDEVSIVATYWYSSDSYTIEEWEAGSPQAADVLNDLRSVTYSKNPLYYLTYRLRRLGGTLIGNAGLLTLVMQDGDGHKYTVGVNAGQFSFNPYGGSLSQGWMASNAELADNLIERVIIMPEN